MKKGFVLLCVLAVLGILICAGAVAEEAAYEPKDLPVVYLQIDGGQEEFDLMNESPDHSYKCTGTMDIRVPEGYGGDFEGRYPQENVQGLKMKYIRGRGNGTWGMNKNPYKIKLEEKADLFGMGKSKTWILLANVYDNSLIRNRLVAWLGDRVGLEYTPQGVFVELVMNGEYWGNYYLCESVQVGKHRVAIDELQEGDTELPDIQGGYLLEFNPDEWDAPDTFETEHGQLFATDAPGFDPEDGGYENEAQMNYIRTFIQQAENAVYAEDGLAEDGRSYTEYIDVQSLADYWWIQEFTINEDAFQTDSAHMFKKRLEADGSEGKLHFGPLWDFDASMGNQYPETTQGIGFNNATFRWVDALRNKPEFLDLLRERWKVLDEALEEIVRDGGVLDQTIALVKESWARDRARWQETVEEFSLDVGRDLEAEKEHIRGWINLRREWINANLDRLGMMTVNLTVRVEGMEDRVIDQPCDQILDPYMIEVPEIEGREFEGWLLEDGTPVGDYLLMDRDITITAQYK